MGEFRWWSWGPWHKEKKLGGVCRVSFCSKSPWKKKRKHRHRRRWMELGCSYTLYASWYWACLVALGVALEREVSRIFLGGVLSILQGSLVMCDVQAWGWVVVWFGGCVNVTRCARHQFV